jgi:hypothetical protein
MVEAPAQQQPGLADACSPFHRRNRRRIRRRITNQSSGSTPGALSNPIGKSEAIHFASMIASTSRAHHPNTPGPPILRTRQNKKTQKEKTRTSLRAKEPDPKISPDPYVHVEQWSAIAPDSTCAICTETLPQTTAPQASRPSRSGS